MKRSDFCIRSARQRVLVCLLAAFFVCVVVAVLLVRATCPGPVVYLRSTEVADASARRGITPEITEQALKQGLDLASFFTAASLRGAFAEEGGRVTDAKSFAEKCLSLDGRGDYGLHTGRWRNVERRVRKIFGCKDIDLSLSVDGGDTVRLGYVALRGGDTLASGTVTGFMTLPDTVSDALRGRAGLEMAGLEMAGEFYAWTNPLADLLYRDCFRIQEELHTPLQDKIRDVYLCEQAEIRWPEIRDFIRRGNYARKAWCNQALGHLYANAGFGMEDLAALQRARSFYEEARKYDAQAREAVDRRIARIDDYIGDCRKTDSNGELIGRFLDANVQLPDSCRQLILVYNDRPDSVLCAFRRFDKQDDGRWAETFPAIHANVGRRGIAPYGEKLEGDQRTPTGAYPMGFAFGYRDDIDLRWPFLVVTKQHYWISDSEDPMYNRMTTETPATDNFEYLRRDDDAYKYAAVVEYNTRPIEKYKGSAIFFHLESGYNRGSAGCITVTESKVIETLQWLDPHRSPYMLIATQRW
ncbi:Uncharacterized protein conserved in bacteria [Alistipes sp. cv1]|nr:L,D-transpeptidase family protein [uncultured Alistipes sp.]VDR35394.1 Uncharacterized protein conserved in bacteria [Faecalibacterium prausnitzii]